MNSSDEKLCDATIKSRYTVNEDLTILKYIHERTHDPSDGLLEKFRFCTYSKKFWTDFVTDTNTERTVDSLKGRLPKLLKQLHKLPIDVEMKLDLYYSLDRPIHEDFLKEALQTAHICVDENRNIIAFEMKKIQPEVPEGIEKTNRKRRTSSGDVQSAKRIVRKFTPEEDDQMWKFLIEKTTDPHTGEIRKIGKITPNSQTFWNEFVARGAQRTTHSCATHYRKLCENLHKTDLSLEIKTNLHYALNIPINEEFSNQLRAATEMESD